MILRLLIGLWPFPTVVNLLLPQRSAHVGSGVGVVVGVAVGVAVGDAVGVGSGVGVVVGDAVGDAVGVAVGDGVVGPATAGIVRPSATPNTIRLQKNLVNRFISVISPASALDPEPPNTQMQS